MNGYTTRSGGAGSEPAIIFGSGAIARAVLAPLIQANARSVVFVCSGADQARLLRTGGKYAVRIAGSPRRIDVSDFRAFAPSDPGFYEVAAIAGVAFTAVRAKNLFSLAPTISALIRHRLAAGITYTLNIISCENLPVGDAQLHQLRNAVRRLSSAHEYESFVEDRLGLVGAVLDATAMSTPNASGKFDVLTAAGETDILIDEMAIKGELPAIMGLSPVTDFRLHRERKLFIHGLGHAAVAYLSHTKGLRKIAEGMQLKEICSVVREAMRESADALCALHPSTFRSDVLDAYISDLLNRFADSSYGDTVERVGRDAWCKLAPGERIVGALRNAELAGGRTDALRVVLDAAVAYARRDGISDCAYADIPEVAAARPVADSGHTFMDEVLRDRVIERFVDDGADPRIFPRVLVLDVDGTLTETVGQSLSSEMAELILQVRDCSVNVVLLSGFSKARFKDQFLPALKRAGAGNGIAVFGGCGAFGWFYDDLWNEREVHDVTFSAVNDGSGSIPLLATSEIDHLAAAVRRVVPSSIINIRDTHMAFQVADDGSAEAVAASVRKAVVESGLNNRIQERLSGSPTFLANHIRLEVRLSSGGIVNVLLVTKDVGLRLALRAIEERSCGVCASGHTVILDDSIAVGHELYSGNDLLRVRIGQFAPVLFDLSRRAGAGHDSLISVSPGGPAAASVILRRIVDACSRLRQGAGMPAIRRCAAGVYRVDSHGPGVATDAAGPSLPANAAPTAYPAGEAGPNTFEDAVRAGLLRPLIIVSIKNLFRGAAQCYLQEFVRLYGVYNGNANFLLVEQAPSAISHDFPSLFTTIERAQTTLGSDFYDQPVLIVTDAGRKTRNFPLTLRYGFQGLFPFSENASYLREVVSRAGAMFLQLGVPADHAIAIASDSIIDFTALRFHSTDAALSIPLAPLHSGTELSDKVIASIDTEGTIAKVLAKPSPADVARSGVSLTSAPWTLPFAMIWHKRLGLDPFLHSLKAASLRNGCSFVNTPTDFYRGVIEGIYANEQEWAHRCPGEMSDTEWATLRHLALRAFGRHGSKIAYPRLPRGGFRDEGHIQIARRRIELSAPHPLSGISLAPRVYVRNGFFATGSRLVVRGRGHLHIGEHVHFSDVLVDLGDGGNLTIPDGWTLHDCYITASCRFEGTNGFLSGVLRVSRPSGGIAPTTDETFNGESATTMVLSTEGEPIRVDVSMPAAKERLANQRICQGRLRLEELQDRTDVLAGTMASEQLRSVISKDLPATDGLFPLEPLSARVLSSVPYKEFVRQLASDILARKHPSQLFWVTLEGLQGAGKSYLASSLRRELRSRGRSTIIIEEDWSHFSRPLRERLREHDAETFSYHRETWHDWDKNREIVRTVAESGPGYTTLRNLYSRASGECDASKRVYIQPDSIVIYTGFYVSDSSLHDIPDDASRRLSIYLGISPADSLWVKRRRDRWRSPKEIIKFDQDVYRPAFSRYTQMFNPAGKAEYVIRVQPRSRDQVVLVRPFELRQSDGIAHL